MVMRWLCDLSFSLKELDPIKVLKFLTISSYKLRRHEDIVMQILLEFDSIHGNSRFVEKIVPIYFFTGIPKMSNRCR